ncbi:AMP-binding protein [Rhizobium sp. AN69]|uniref:AMP-binding protein n=1 Tax=Rhizobium sp. AN69 TaxID=3035213 RepID=UPI002B25BBF1|nr:AMP-binding protein [Rhizobium sp. AN69]
MARPLPVKGVHDLISGAARLHPEKIAIECIDRSWTYSQLEEASNNLARALLTLEKPVKPGMRVAVSLPGQASGIISFLAIIKTRCGLCSDRSAPPGRQDRLRAGGCRSGSGAD